MNKYSSIAPALRRRARWVAPVALFVGTAGGLAIWPSQTVMSAVQQALADPLAIFADRSPGERAPGALTQTKQAYPILNDASDMPAPPADMLMEASPLPVPGEDVPKAFAAIVPPDNIGGVPVGSVPGPGLVLPESAPTEGTPGVTLPNLPVLGPSAPPPVILQPDVPPTSGPPVVSPPPTLGPPDVPGVPEPASWATMIVGFLTVGTILRRSVGTGKAADRQTDAG